MPLVLISYTQTYKNSFFESTQHAYFLYVFLIFWKILLHSCKHVLYNETGIYQVANKGTGEVHDRKKPLIKQNIIQGFSSFFLVFLDPYFYILSPHYTMSQKRSRRSRRKKYLKYLNNIFNCFTILFIHSYHTLQLVLIANFYYLYIDIGKKPSFQSYEKCTGFSKCQQKDNMKCQSLLPITSSVLVRCIYRDTLHNSDVDVAYDVLGQVCVNSFHYTKKRKNTVVVIIGFIQSGIF